MKEYKNISKELQRMLDKAEELDWTYAVYEEPRQNNRTFVEMGKYSPAGEDFSMIIDFDAEDQAESFLKDLWDYADNFDIDDHVEMWLPERGKGGCPDTARELVEDAEAIVEMIKELYGQMDSVLHLELSDEQSARCDEIYNAVYEMCKVVAGDEELEWDMHYIGEIAEMTAKMMSDRGYKVRFPAIVTEEDGTQHIEEYYELDRESSKTGKEYMEECGKMLNCCREEKCPYCEAEYKGGRD